MAWMVAAFLSSIALVPVLVLTSGAERVPDGRDVAAVTVTGGSSAQVELFDDMTGRFERAGLELPALSVTFDPGEAACDGALGHHRFTGTRSHIEVCAEHIVEPAKQRYVFAHELAHAWLESTLDEQARGEYVTHAGLPAWDDDAVPWELRGSEHAADTIVWGVLGHRGVLLQAPHTPCERLYAGYFELTTRLPVGGSAACEET